MKAQALLGSPYVRTALVLLDGDGEETRIVGGAIRNALLDRPVKDYDLATTASPKVVMARATAAGLRTIPTGIAHGTVTMIVDGRAFEITTLREDVETDGRHAIVRFGRDFARDALRRDFTINALSMGLDGTIHDYADGLADLDAGRVRFIGEPVTRIREDYLRILRFFRFSADYATGPLDAAGLDAVIAEKDGLGRLSRERVGQEMLRLLVAGRAVPIIAAMAGAGLFGAILDLPPHVDRLARLVAIDPGASVTLRLTVLFATRPEDVDHLRDGLRLSNAEAARIAGTMTARTLLQDAQMAPQPERLLELLFECGRVHAVAGLLQAWAETRAEPDDVGWLRARCFLQDTPEPKLPFSAAELKARGVAAGPLMGDALKRLQADWIKAGFPRDPRRLADLLENITPRD